MDNSPFARLSPELRIMIWKLDVTRDLPIYIHCCREKPTSRCRGPPDPPITRVCKQIREESIGLFYGENIFIGAEGGNRQHHPNSELRLAYETVGPERYGLIKFFEIWTDNVSESEIMEDYVITKGTEEVLDGRRLFGVTGDGKDSFQGPQVIRTTAHHSMTRAFTSEWVRGADKYYRRVKDSESAWVQERIKAIRDAIKNARNEEIINGLIGYDKWRIKPEIKNAQNEEVIRGLIDYDWSFYM